MQFGVIKLKELNQNKKFLCGKLCRGQPKVKGFGCVCVYIYIYTKRERERERERTILCGSLCDILGSININM